MSFKKFRLPWGIDWALFIVPLLLSIFGVVMIFSVTYSVKPLLVISQIIYIFIGFAVAIFLTFFDYRNLRSFSLFLYLIIIVLLILVLIFGDRTFGAARWIDLKVFQLQPSELAKLVVVLLLARIFAENQKNFGLKHLILVFMLVGIPVFLVLQQPDFGTAMVIFFGLLCLLFFSNIKKVILISILAGLILSLPVGWHFLKTYQKQRIYTFINPSLDPYGSGYNVTQAKITVGSGGLLGQGIGQGTQIQLNFLPVAHSDFIFATTAESVGFIGSTFLIILLLFLVYSVLGVARKAKDLFGFYFAIAWGMILLFQIFVNIGMNLGIMPVTGIPLPFVSYGGSSMLTNMAALGILQSIYLRHRKITF
ncbi:MAG: Rod shape-determining protein RodA [Berkelbacteria bacterium GW2011_GWA1_36_9]|uniref:Peptidoglycan glycosyltransferase RodA n=1 Tax=Berkelbacteria bacterium GW2011_GWA1_36_9 TaxID=1618331 RepID=A0A0G0FWB7_9BACT|nr:MAG: Rod shape-determining protein RodA [Berkelbacteria bacterium GW2011_GWA1_36_9]